MCRVVLRPRDLSLWAVLQGRWRFCEISENRLRKMFRREGLEKQENKDMNVELCMYVCILCLSKKKKMHVYFISKIL